MAEYILCKDIDTPKSPIIPPPSPTPGDGGIPSGGTTGQALVKKSNASGDVEWKTIGEGSAILYPTTGQNTDGAMTQKATTDALALKADAATVTTQLADKADKSTVPAPEPSEDFDAFLATLFA